MKIGSQAISVTTGAVLVSALTAVPAAADTVAPDATIHRPALQDEVFGRKALSFSGTATDDTGVASVGVAFQDRGTRLWYRPDGTWGAYHRFTATLSRPGQTGTDWSYVWTPPSAGAFLLQVVAKDTAGHPDAVLPFRRFDVDTAPPDTSITSPGSQKNTIRRGRTAVLSGTARDDHGVLSIRVAVQNARTGKWLRPGGVWGALHWYTFPVDRPGAPATSWRYSLKMSLTGTFLIKVAAADRAGLVDPTPASRQYTSVS